MTNSIISVLCCCARASCEIQHWKGWKQSQILLSRLQKAGDLKSNFLFQLHSRCILQLMVQQRRVSGVKKNECVCILRNCWKLSSSSNSSKASHDYWLYLWLVLLFFEISHLSFSPFKYLKHNFHREEYKINISRACISLLLSQKYFEKICKISCISHQIKKKNKIMTKKFIFYFSVTVKLKQIREEWNVKYANSLLVNGMMLSLFIFISLAFICFTDSIFITPHHSHSARLAGYTKVLCLACNVNSFV